MTASLLDSAPIVPASVHAHFRHETTLAAMTQELASVHSSMLVLVRSAKPHSLDAGDLARVREEVAQLRVLYFEKIDEIAISFGVQRAIEAKESVECSVKILSGMLPPAPNQESEEFCL